MNYISIALIVGEQHVRREVDHVRFVDEGTIHAEEVFRRGAKAMFEELLKTHAIVPRKVSASGFNASQPTWDHLLKLCEVKP